MIPLSDLQHRIEAALAARQDLLQEPHQGAFRLFAGFFEGCPELVIDAYGPCLVLFDYSDPPGGWGELLTQALPAWLVDRLPWVTSILLKNRQSTDENERRGRLVWGKTLPESLIEDDIHYALDLRLNQDCGFYLDTRELRRWLHASMRGKLALNTFAYTGSLGAAALAGGADRVIQTDRTRRFLDLAGRTCRLNGWPDAAHREMTGDYYRVIAGLKKAGSLFDCVILDPPFFSSGVSGKVDIQAEYVTLANKIRPLVAHDGCLVLVNNSIFTSGAQFSQSLEQLCTNGYLHLAERILVPEDVAGYPATRVSRPPADPAPFNHSTKIAVLRVTRKDGAIARKGLKRPVE